MPGFCQFGSESLKYYKPGSLGLNRKLVVVGWVRRSNSNRTARGPGGTRLKKDGSASRSRPHSSRSSGPEIWPRPTQLVPALGREDRAPQALVRPASAEPSTFFFSRRIGWGFNRVPLRKAAVESTRSASAVHAQAPCSCLLLSYSAQSPAHGSHWQLWRYACCKAVVSPGGRRSSLRVVRAVPAPQRSRQRNHP